MQSGDNWVEYPTRYGEAMKTGSGYDHSSCSDKTGQKGATQSFNIGKLYLHCHICSYLHSNFSLDNFYHRCDMCQTSPI